MRQHPPRWHGHSPERETDPRTAAATGLAVGLFGLAAVVAVGALAAAPTGRGRVGAGVWAEPVFGLVWAVMPLAGMLLAAPGMLASPRPRGARAAVAGNAALLGTFPAAGLALSLLPPS